MKRVEQELIDGLEDRLLDRLMERLSKKQRKDQGNQRTGSPDPGWGEVSGLYSFGGCGWLVSILCFCVPLQHRGELWKCVHNKRTMVAFWSLLDFERGPRDRGVLRTIPAAFCP